MSPVEKLTISLAEDQASYIDILIASGRYATATEVVDAGLRALQERDAVVESWLRDQVVPTAAAMKTDPGRAVSAETVFAGLRDLHEQRLKDE